MPPPACPTPQVVEHIRSDVSGASSGGEGQQQCGAGGVRTCAQQAAACASLHAQQTSAPQPPPPASAPQKDLNDKLQALLAVRLAQADAAGLDEKPRPQRKKAADAIKAQML